MLTRLIIRFPQIHLVLSKMPTVSSSSTPNPFPHCLKTIYDSRTLCMCGVSAIDCDSPPSPVNGTQFPVTNTSQPYGAIVSYQCLDGRRFEDGRTFKNILCTGGGQWNDTWLTCDCNTLLALFVLYSSRHWHQLLERYTYDYFLFFLCVCFHFCFRFLQSSCSQYFIPRASRNSEIGDNWISKFWSVLRLVGYLPWTSWFWAEWVGTFRCIETLNNNTETLKDGRDFSWVIGGQKIRRSSSDIISWVTLFMPPMVSNANEKTIS